MDNFKKILNPDLKFQKNGKIILLFIHGSFLSKNGKNKL